MTSVERLACALRRKDARQAFDLSNDVMYGIVVNERKKHKSRKPHYTKVMSLMAGFYPTFCRIVETHRPNLNKPPLNEVKRFYSRLKRRYAGHVIDLYRSENSRTRIRYIDQWRAARSVVENRNMRKATWSEISHESGLGVIEYQRAFQSPLHPLLMPMTSADGDIDALGGEEWRDFGRIEARAALADRIGDARIRGHITARESLIFLFSGAFTKADIAGVFDLSPARVGQIASKVEGILSYASDSDSE